ncbi:MAG: helix-turn-helix domain-containing protein [Caldilineaceae bacterium]
MCSRIHECPVETSLELLSGKWKPRILWKLHQQGVIRFGELKRQLADITPKMLTQQLRELEQDGLVHREVYPVVPPKVEYSLSDFGKTLKPILDTLAEWGTAHHNTVIEILSEQDA